MGDWVEGQESDAALWLEASRGTERSFATIFDRHRTRVFRAAYRRVGNISDAEDIVAIVFLEAWRLRKKVRIVDGSLLPWLLTVTTNVTLNQGRSQRRYRLLLSKLPPAPPEVDHAPVVEDRLDSREQGRRLTEALRKLSPGDRAVVNLCLIEELSLADTAAALALPLGTVKSRLHRARGQLRTELSAADIPMQDRENEGGRT